MSRPLTIFLPHCSDLLTDYRPHGDGLVANGFVRHLAARGHRLIVAAPEVSLEMPLPENVEVHVLGRSGGEGLLARLIYMWRVRRLFAAATRDRKIDVIHQLNPVYTGVSLALADSGIPVVLGPYVGRWPEDPHAISSSRSSLRALLGKGHALLGGWQQRKASVLLLTTEAARDRLEPGYYREDQVRLLPHGLDTTYWAPLEECLPARQGEIAPVRILFLSNLSQRKGIFDLLQAFESIAAAYPHAVLQVAGAGEEAEAVGAVVATLASRPQIQLLGRQTRERSRELLQGCDIFCQPSHGEPFGMSAAEAMACGKPVIATRTGGLGYLVTDETGVRVPPADVPALAGALSTLLDSPSLRERLGRAARERMLATVAWDRVLDDLEASFAEAMKIPGTVSQSVADDVPNELHNCI